MAINEELQIKQELLSVTKETISEEEREDFLNFQNASQKFLTQIEMISNKYESVISKSNLKQKIWNLYKDMRESSVYTQEILKYQHEFEVALNNFLNRTIYLTYVSSDGRIYFYGDYNIGQLYEQATANKGRGNISATKMFEVNDLQENIKKNIENSMKNKKRVYQEALTRYRRNKTEEHMNYHISEKTFYWWAKFHKTLAGWTGPIVNEGPIAEGYAGAVINEDSEINNSNIEHSLEMLWKNHIQKDSVGAAIKGDIVLKSDGSIQFAVKSGSFSTAKVRQYILLAYNILKLKMLTPDQLLNSKIFYRLTTGGLSTATDKIIDEINNNIFNKIDNLISQVDKK